MNTNPWANPQSQELMEALSQVAQAQTANFNSDKSMIHGAGEMGPSMPRDLAKSVAQQRNIAAHDHMTAELMKGGGQMAHGAASSSNIATGKGQTINQAKTELRAANSIDGGAVAGNKLFKDMVKRAGGSMTRFALMMKGLRHK
jgi:hypothetical protein